jgi:YNFM family putative membrane transporter
VGVVPRITAGEPAFHRATVALVAASFATFALLYATQPLLPLLTRDLGVSPATAALSLAVTTAALGVALLPAGWLSDAIGRTPVIVGSVCIAALLGVACAAAPSLPVLLVLRALQGIALAGMPAVAMAYLAEEIDPASLGRSIGLLVGGNAIGGMGGRIAAAAFADVAGWRGALLAVGVLGAVCAAITVRALPPSRNFTRRPLQRDVLRRLRMQLTEPGLVRLYAMGGLLMGTLVAVFNGLGFRLTDEPYGLSQATLGAVFLVYVLGSVSSARAGALADRVGRRVVLPAGVVIALAGLALTAATPLALVIAGTAVLAIGFFAAHSVAASWVGRRAVGDPAQASALYFLAYYPGSSVAGTLAGSAWSAARWDGVLLLTGALLAVALFVALSLRGTQPLAAPASPSEAARWAKSETMTSGA